MRLQGESHISTVLVISLVELHQVIVVDNIEQVYVVTPIHSFLFTIESFDYSSCLNNVFVVKMVNENIFESDTQK